MNCPLAPSRDRLTLKKITPESAPGNQSNSAIAATVRILPFLHISPLPPHWRWYQLVLPGWTTDRDEMGYDYYWHCPNGVGQLAAKRIGLSKATGIMSSTLDSGDPYYLFQSCSKYYWNQIEGNIWEIESPTHLEDILVEIRDRGLGKLEALQLC